MATRGELIVHVPTGNVGRVVDLCGSVERFFYVIAWISRKPWGPLQSAGAWTDQCEPWHGPVRDA